MTKEKAAKVSLFESRRATNPPQAGYKGTRLSRSCRRSFLEFQLTRMTVWGKIIPGRNLPVSLPLESAIPLQGPLIESTLSVSGNRRASIRRRSHER